MVDHKDDIKPGSKPQQAPLPAEASPAQERYSWVKSLFPKGREEPRLTDKLKLAMHRDSQSPEEYAKEKFAKRLERLGIKSDQIQR